MKQYKFLCLVFLTPAVLASGSVELNIQNFSKQTLTIKKENGEKILIPPQGMMQHVSFALNSEPEAYIENKYMCTFVGISYHDNMEPVKLNYNDPYPHMFKCATIYVQHKIN